MQASLYKLVGTVHIPNEKKAEFNAYVLQVLKSCGIRKTEEINLGGKKVMVVKLPEADENGMVLFDYSIFEKRKRETSTYNLCTCELITPDPGYAEFGIAMYLLMTLQEAYSSKHCYLTKEEKPCSVDTFAAVLKGILEIDLSFPNRENGKDMLLFFKEQLHYENITPNDIINSYPYITTIENPISLPFYKSIQRTNEDEFIDLWNDKELLFSSNMKVCFADWKDEYEQMEDSTIDEVDMENTLASIIIDLDKVWSCRLVDKEFVTEFLAHAEDDNYKRAIVLFRDILDVYTYYFPELTKEQVLYWITQSSATKFEKVSISAYQSLLNNHKHRKEILGF